MSPLSMLAFSRLDMASTVQFLSALRSLPLRFLASTLAPPRSSPVASSEQSFKRFMNNVKNLQTKQDDRVLPRQNMNSRGL